jgi:multidrug resistance efflux pump
VCAHAFRKEQSFEMAQSEIAVRNDTMETPRRRARVWAVRVAVAAVVTLVLTFVTYPLKITEPVEMRPATRRDVRAQVRGVIAEIRKGEGAEVVEGEVLAILDVREQRARVTVLEAERAQHEAELAKLLHGSRPEEVRRAEQATLRARSALDFAEKSRARSEQLFVSRAISEQALDGARFDAHTRSRELAGAEAELQIVRAGARLEDVAAKRAEIQRVDAELALMRGDIERSEIKSPVAGTILTPRVEETVGRAVMQGDLVLEVGDLRTMRIEVLVPERELDALEIGQPVVVKVKSAPSETLHGTVTFVPVVTTLDEARQLNVVRVVAVVENRGALLKDKMTGWAEIHAGRRSLLSLAGRRAVRWLRVRLVV